jgi:MraZ protein
MVKSGSFLIGLYGQFHTTLDDKGRLSLPARLRSVISTETGRPLLEGELILTGGLEGCLALYPPAEWSDIQSRMSKLNFTQKDYRFFSRRFYSSAAVVSPDKSGRILVPSHLITAANLQKELMVIGVARSIEIWGPIRYQEYVENYDASYEDVAERLFTGDAGSKE